jgi:two-component system chemotaxis response regulator CheY
MPKPTRILVVDDFPTMRRIVRNLLLELGYEDVAEADDGRTALPMLQAGGFDLLITDWNMPGMHGLDLLRQVRADERLARLPVVLLTVESRREQIVEAVEAGVNAVVMKPFTAEVLAEKLGKIFPAGNA